MDNIAATGLFALIALGVAVAVVAAMVAGFVLYVWFFFLRPDDPPKPCRKSRQRVRTFLRAKGPSHTVILDPHPEAHGEVTRAVYPCAVPAGAPETTEA